MSVRQYLQHYAEAESHLANAVKKFINSNSAFCHNFCYEHVVAIPAFNEAETLIHRVAALNTNKSILVILVLNAPDKNLQHKALQQTQELSQGFKQRYPSLSQLSATAHLLELSQSFNQHLLLIEHCSDGCFLPHKQGVGLARKIACDIACQLIHNKAVSSPWIHSTDADVSLPEKYFDSDQQLNPKVVAAALYPFTHTCNSNSLLQLAQNLYDLSLDYYVEGLAWANSPFAFQTVGSTLLINHESYALCRGFPKKSAGEDFYLLNKMAKVGEIVSLTSPELKIDSRQSDRVPFGTGPALSKILQLEKPLQNYLYYHPHCFYYLQQWLRLLPDLWHLLNTHDSENNQHFPLAWLSSLSSEKLDTGLLYLCLQSININTGLQHAQQQSKSQAVFIKHMHNWFDGFKTLKFIHFLRENGLASVNASTLVAQADFISSELKHQFIQLTD